MADQFVAEIRLFPFNFAPLGWAFCDGQLLAISQNTALFSLIGTYYGGNGTSNFALPNLQGDFALDQGQGVGLTDRVIGETGGEAAVTLLLSEIPAHLHTVQCATTSNTSNPSNAVFGTAGRGKPPAYAPGPGSVNLSAGAVSSVGGSQPHNNMPPFLVMNFCIAMQGIFPSRA